MEVGKEEKLGWNLVEYVKCKCKSSVVCGRIKESGENLDGDERFGIER